MPDLIANPYILQMQFAHPLPSRLFRFPVSIVKREDACILLLNHPDLAGWPCCNAIERATGSRPVWEPLDEYGRDRGANWRYYHAVDLMTDAHWSDLLATRNFTDRAAIVIALRYARDFGGIGTDAMRAVLAAIASEEPADRSAGFLQGRVWPETLSGGVHVRFTGNESEQSIWAAVHGLEAGLFRRDRNGFMRFSKSFLAQLQSAAKGPLHRNEEGAGVG